MRQSTELRDPLKGKTRGSRDFASPIQELMSTATKLGLGRDAANRAQTICGEVARQGLCRLVSPNVIAAASLYIASRELGSTTTLKEIASAYECDARDVGRCYVSILDRMHISRPGLNGKGYARHLLLRRPVSEEAYGKSEEIIRHVTAAGLGGRNPMTLAAAALYLACCDVGEVVTQAEVAEGAGVGEESVRECCKAIRTISGTLTA